MTTELATLLSAQTAQQQLNSFFSNVNEWADTTEYIMYVDGTNGSDDYSGATSLLAKKTIQAAVNSSPIIHTGIITINIAAGTYNEGLLIDRAYGPKQFNFVGKVDGSDIPTVIIERGNVGAYGLYAEYYKRVKMTNIKIQNCTNFGAEVAFFSQLEMDNVFIDNCSVYGIKVWDLCYGNIHYSAISNCDSSAIICYGSSILPCTSNNISSCINDGVYLANSSSGHIDGCTIDQCSNYGIHIVDSSYTQVGITSPALPTTITRCGGGIYCTFNSVAYPENVVYGTGGNANTSFDAYEDAGGIIGSLVTALTSNPHPNIYTRKSHIYFEYDNAASSLTNQIMNTLGNNTIAFYLMPDAGSVVGLSIYSKEERTAGTLTAQVSYGGTPISGCIAIIDGTNTQLSFATFNPGVKTFGKGALQVLITTSSDWAPTTADIQVVVSVLV